MSHLFADFFISNPKPVLILPQGMVKKVQWFQFQWEEFISICPTKGSTVSSFNVLIDNLLSS